MYDPRIPHVRTPEHPSTSPEAGNSLAELLSGVHELSAVSGMSVSDFLQTALEEAEKSGNELDEEGLDTIAMSGFGTREEALERIRGLSEAEFSETYPGAVGDIVLNFVSPLFAQE